MSTYLADTDSYYVLTYPYFVTFSGYLTTHRTELLRLLGIETTGVVDALKGLAVRRPKKKAAEVQLRVEIRLTGVVS
ncbi:MAG TPA: hypothetical protein VIY52_15010 [Streptosporangiaceae bacterium]